MPYRGESWPDDPPSARARSPEHHPRALRGGYNHPLPERIVRDPDRFGCILLFALFLADVTLGNDLQARSGGVRRDARVGALGSGAAAGVGTVRVLVCLLYDVCWINVFCDVQVVAMVGQVGRRVSLGMCRPIGKVVNNC